MRLLRFHQELYDGFAIDEAVKAFGAFATFELEREAIGYAVKLTANEGVDEETIANELANYALGKSIERRVAV